MNSNHFIVMQTFVLNEILNQLYSDLDSDQIPFDDRYKVTSCLKPVSLFHLCLN